MRAEDQTMQIEDAHGQQTVQCLFVQVGKVQYPSIGPCVFEMGPDKRLQYVFAGTFEHYQQFRALMEGYACFPAHEIPGETLNIGDAAGAKVHEEPVVETDPGKTAADTLSAPAEIINDGMTDAERALHVQAQGGNDDAVQRAQLANGGQSTAGAGDQAGGTDGGDHDVNGGGSASDQGGGEGRAPAADNGGGTVSPEVTQQAGGAAASPPQTGAKADAGGKPGKAEKPGKPDASTGAASKPDPFADI